MRRARYRIDEISIEGFRGFTEAQVIACRGDHLFVFGPNGQGKSSIIEAIRWCLFGSQSEKEIEVRNTYYDTGDCIVSLTLSGADDQLHMKRVLRPGVARSRLSIRNAAGVEVTLQDALPELARIGHEQGTQVIFAAQQSVGRQATVDISDFTEVLCFYLHLEDVPDLAKRLHRVFNERIAESEKLAARLETAEQQYRQLLNQLQTKLTVLLANPPWGDGAAPTGEETETKIAALLTEQSRLRGMEMPILSGKAAIDEIRRWMGLSDAKTDEERKGRFDSLADQLRRAQGHLDEFRKAAGRASSIRAERTAAEARLAELLAGGTTDQLRSEAHRVEQSMTARDVRVEIARLAATLCENHEVTACPLCDKKISSRLLRTAITNHRDEAEGAAEEGERLAGLQATLNEIDRVTKLLEAHAKALAGAESAESGVTTALRDVLGVDAPVEVEQLERHLEKLAADLESLRREIDATAAERQRRIKVVKDLEAELNYHAYRDQVDETQRRLGVGLDPVRAVLASYRELVQAVADLASLVDSAFDEALDRIAPVLNSLLTEVYRRLTHQMSYDEIRISKNPDPPHRRELRVASTRLVGQTFAPNVLNGQAAKALHLVPYFVFSRFQPEIMELDLLLIDDPSESFDTSHVESLVSELADAGKHAQLIVATHEREKFEPHLRKMLAHGPYRIAAVEGFDPLKGPTIACR